jgi:hypothetical protein
VFIQTGLNLAAVGLLCLNEADEGGFEAAETHRYRPLYRSKDWRHVDAPADSIGLALFLFFSSAFDDEGKESSASACWVQIEQRRRDGGMFRAPFLTVPGDAMSKPRLLAWRSLLAKAKFVWRRAAPARPGQDMH